MAGARISIEFETGPAIDLLRKLGEHVDDLTPLFGQIGEYLKDSTTRRFEAQESPDGTPWAPLSPAYARRKKKNADKILVLDGVLRDYTAYNPEPRSLEFGTGLQSKDYAASHQFGRDAIPARPFLGISDEDENEILLLLREYVETAL